MTAAGTVDGRSGGAAPRRGGGLTRRAIPIALLTAALAAGCTAWGSRPLSVLRTPLAPRDRVQLWVGAGAYDVHGVVVTGDSLRAVPFLKPPDCDSCALHLAVRDIDSVRVPIVDEERTRQDLVTTAVMSGLAMLVVIAVLWAKGMKGY